VAEVVSEEGVEGATMRKIATRAQVSTGMLTYYYRDKRHLITATLAAAAQHFQKRTDSMVGEASDLRRIENWYDIIFPERDEATPPWSFWLELWAHATRDPEMRWYHAARIEMGRQAFARHIATGMSKGQLDSDLDSTAAAELLLALSYGLGVMVTLASDTVSPQRALHLGQLLLSLLGPSEARRPA
jgi:TetR/AcrR family transcriptional regulator, transcriptional repressor of bet genes